MSYLDAQIGPYYYDPAYIDRKTYGVDRGFTILISGAYDAGIIGSEHNGIVILDDDNGSVVLDQHFIEASGAFGPSRRQVDEYARLRGLSWQELGAFVRSHPRYRHGTALDLVGGGDPERGDLVTQRRVGRDVVMPKGKDIRSKEMRALDRKKQSEYRFPLKTRKEILAFLGGHPLHAADRYDCCLAWNIEIRNPELSGRCEGGEPVEDRFDALWDRACDKDAAVFYGALEDALSTYLDGDYTTPPGDDQGSYEFHTADSSGGWLVLSKFDGDRTVFRGADQLRDWMSELDDASLAKLYKLVVSVDHDVAGRDLTVSRSLNFVRSNKEQEWRDEPTAAVEQAVEVGLPFVELGRLAKSLGVDVVALVETLGDASVDDDDILEAAAELGPEAKEKAESLIASPGLSK
jgi:hypothetical protein